MIASPAVDDDAPDDWEALRLCETHARTVTHALAKAAVGSDDDIELPLLERAPRRRALTRAWRTGKTRSSLGPSRVARGFPLALPGRTGRAFPWPSCLGHCTGTWAGAPTSVMKRGQACDRTTRTGSRAPVLCSVPNPEDPGRLPGRAGGGGFGCTAGGCFWMNSPRLTDTGSLSVPVRDLGPPWHRSKGSGG